MLLNRLGAPVALSADGSVAVAAAPNAATDASPVACGAVLVFTRGRLGRYSRAAIMAPYIKNQEHPPASRGYEGPQFGLALALSADGNWLTITGGHAGTAEVDQSECVVSGAIWEGHNEVASMREK